MKEDYRVCIKIVRKPVGGELEGATVNKSRSEFKTMTAGEIGALQADIEAVLKKHGLPPV